jgi:hypothetical protein
MIIAFAAPACTPASGTLIQDGSRILPSAAAGTACAPAASTEEKDLVCSRWACDHAALVAAAWDGDAKRCAAGRMDEQAQARALRLVNTYRFLAGVPELAIEPQWAGPAQECALLAHANRQLSHSPPQDWSCWSDRAARASAVSLIANRSAPLAIDPFIEDPGNESTMVHRRWLLSEKIHRLALGSTNGFTCALVDGRQFEAPPPDETKPSEVPSDATNGGSAVMSTLAAPREWVAWPPPGPVPIDALRLTKADETGWTLQSSTLDLDGARVEVRLDGSPRPLKITPLEQTLGSFTAIRFVPDGWSTESGKRYDVHAEKEGVAIDFAVEPRECP